MHIMASLCMLFFSSPPHNLNKAKLEYQKTAENTHHNKEILSRVNLSVEAGEKKHPII